MTKRVADPLVDVLAEAGVRRIFAARQELAMPRTITLEQAKGFSLFMLKAVLNGRGDEIIDLARVNLLR